MTKRTLVHDPRLTPRSTKKRDKPSGRVHPTVSEVDAALDRDISRDQLTNTGDFDRGTVSTGSTLLDLAISANRIIGGGIPAGVIVEVYGPSSSGKTAILAEIGASAKSRGGCVLYDDPEARLDTSYAARCGLVLSDDEYNRPDTVDELENAILSWEPKPTREGAICVRCEDSLAAFSTVAEIEKGHKMASAKRAQAFHQLFRKLGRKINGAGWVIACSNQEQVNFDTGARTTPGGNAIKYWSSIRIRIARDTKNQGGELKRTWRISQKATVEKVIGIRSIAKVIKNSCDDPFREVPLYIVFGQGIDDVRGNLQWVKDTLSADTYDCIDKHYSKLGPAIRYIEEYNLEHKLREKVIALYADIEQHFRTDRKQKVRF